MSWVRRSVRTRICCTGPILGAMAGVDSRELDAYRERIDRFIADLDQEYYDHFAGLKEDFDLESIYGEYEDVTSLERAQAHAGGRRRQLRLDRALALRVRGLPRRADAPARGALGRARGDAEGAGRRRGDPVPDAEADDREQRRPRPPRADRARAQRADRGAPQPDPARRARGDARGDARARRVELPRALRQVRLPPRRPRRAMPRVPRLDRGAVRGRGRPHAARERRRRPRGGAALGRRARLPRDELGLGVPRRQDAPRARGDALGARDRPPRAGEHPPRRRGASAQVAARVLLADRGARQGDARHPADRRPGRLACALPRSRPRGALREHARRARRSRSAASATAPSPRAGRC